MPISMERKICQTDRPRNYKMPVCLTTMSDNQRRKSIKYVRQTDRLRNYKMPVCLTTRGGSPSNMSDRHNGVHSYASNDTFQVENKNVGLKVWGGGGHKHTNAPPIKNVGGSCPPCTPPPHPASCTACRRTANLPGLA